MKNPYPLLLAAVFAALSTVTQAQSPSPSASAPVNTTPVPGSPDPVVGDAVNVVFNALGRPNGVITNPDKSNLLMYDRGTVIIANGKVAEVKLMPLATYNAKLAAEAAADADRQASSARANALLQVLIADPAYQVMSTRDRMAALAKFDREHPGSDAKKYLADLNVVYSSEQMAQAHITDLENQVNQAKNQANLYQQQVADAQRRLQEALRNKAAADQQASLASQQAQLAQSQGAASKSPLVTTNAGPGSNTAGSKVGQGGAVLTPNSFGTTPPVAPGATPPIAPGATPPIAPGVNPPITPGPNSSVPPGGKWVTDPDGTPRYIPGNGGS
ncbi:MAG TPA: hypothetical protein VHC95_04065 [Opitutales bacterium]|nr:hypothetical protein [Opitutales bacterium]